MHQSKNPFRLGGHDVATSSRGFARRLFDSTIERLLGLHRLAETYDTLRRESERFTVSSPPATLAADFSARVLQRFGVSWELNEDGIQHIPASGPAIIVANHPFGGLEGLILVDLLSRVRTDFRLLANYLVSRIEELRECVIAVDPFAERRQERLCRMNTKAYRQALQWLHQDGLLVMFPAGAVSHASNFGGSVVDPDWSQTAVRLATAREMPIVPIFFAGQNSRLFQWAGLIDSRLRTALLPREMTAKRGHVIRLNIGRPSSVQRLASFADTQLATDFMRIRTYMHGAHHQSCESRHHGTSSLQVGTGLPKIDPIIELAVEPGQLREEIASLDSEHLLLSKGVFDFYCTPAGSIPELLKEIGRLREVTFRNAGEGTGRRIDLDRFDTDYLHLFAWNRERNQVAGAYRLAQASDIVQRNGLAGLYTNSLFKYSHDFLDQLGSALEMGRSFVALDYQRSPEVLFGLWQGIGELIWRNPSTLTLFGTVSISRAYSNCSRQFIVEYLRRRLLRQDLSERVQTLHPYQDFAIKGLQSRHYDCLQTPEHLEEVIVELEGTGIPVLLKHYLRLGAEAIAFGVDRGFADAVDILIAVDVRRTDPRRVERFMGKDRAMRYLQQHGIETGCKKHSPCYSAVSQAEQLSRLPRQSSTWNR